MLNKNRIMDIALMAFFIMVTLSFANAGAIPISTQISVPDNNMDNNYKLLEVDVVKTQTPKIVFRPIDFYTEGAFAKAVDKHYNFLKATYPFAGEAFAKEIDNQIYKSGFTAGSTLSGLDQQFMLWQLYVEEILARGFAFDRVIGIVPSSWFEERGLDSGGFTKPLLSLGVSFLPSFFVSAVAEEMPLLTTAHEIGHTYGLCDEYSLSSWANQDSLFFGGCGNRYPPSCSEEQESCKGDSEISGFNVAEKGAIESSLEKFYLNSCQEAMEKENYESEINKKDCSYECDPNEGLYVVTCRKYYCFMGNNFNPDSAWISAPSYEHLLSQFTVSGSLSLDSTSTSSLERVAYLLSLTQSLLISGLADKNGWVGLEDFYMLDRVAEGEIPDGNYSLKLLDAGGNVLFDQNFGVSFVMLTDPPVDLNTAGFVFTVPFPEGTHKIQIDFNGATRAERLVSANAPEAYFISPVQGDGWSSVHTVEWATSDSDGGSVSSALQYSSDKGLSWNPLAIGLNGTTFDFDARAFAPGDSYLLKVIVTDGVLTGEAVSEVFFIKNPDIDIQPWNFDFGGVEQGTIVSTGLDLLDTGNEALEVSGITTPQNALVSGPGFPLFLMPGDYAKFSLDFNTTGLEGLVDANIVFVSNDPNEAEKHFFIQGNVYIVPPSVTIDLNVPLEVDSNQFFPVHAEISAEDAALLDTNALIVVPQGLLVSGQETIRVGDIAAGGTALADWNVLAQEAGLYGIAVVVSAANAADKNSVRTIAVHNLEANLDLNSSFLLGRQVQIRAGAINHNPSVSYSDLNLLVVVTQPDASAVEFSYYIPLLYAEGEANFGLSLEAGILGKCHVAAVLLTGSGSVISQSSAEFSVFASDPCEGADADVDGDVDRYDLIRLTGGFGRADCDSSNGWCDGADANLDGKVNHFDYINLKRHFGRADCIAD